METKDAYIIYSIKDCTIADLLIHNLLNYGIKLYSCDYGIKDIELNNLYNSEQDTVLKSIEMSEVILFLLSSNSLRSRYALKELQFAYASNKSIIPILLEPWDDLKHIKPIEDVEFLYRLNCFNFYGDCMAYLGDLIRMLVDRWIKPNIEEKTRLKLQNDDIWVFLSHSNEDFNEVRKLRNMMEEHGLRPLMFFLKCLNSDPEIFDLITREIDVRPRFFLCSSKNADHSKWVQREVEYIKSQKRQYITVDLRKPEEFERLIAEITQRSQVYISYSNNEIDAQIYNQLANSLQSKQFNIYNSRQYLRYRDDGLYHIDIIRDIQKISRDGYFMPIISETYLEVV